MKNRTLEINSLSAVYISLQKVMHDKFCTYLVQLSNKVMLEWVGHMGRIE